MALRALLALALIAGSPAAQDVEAVNDYLELYFKEEASAEDREELARDLLLEAEALFPQALEGEDFDVGFAFVQAGELALIHELTPDEIPLLSFCRLGVDLARKRQLLRPLYNFAVRGARFAEDAGDLPKAKEFLLDAYPFNGVAPDRRATALTSLARLYRRDSRWEDGLRMLMEAETTLREVEEAEPTTSAQVLVLGERAQNLISQGKFQAAVRVLERMETWVARTGDQELLGQAAHHRVQLALAMGDFSSVVTQVRALRETPAFEALPRAIHAELLGMEAIALARYAHGTPQEAAVLEEARAMLDRVRTEFGAEELVALHTDLILVEFALLTGDLERAADELELAATRIERAGGETGSSELGTLQTALAFRVARLAGAEPGQLARRKQAFEVSFEAFLQRWSAGRADADVAFLRSAQRRTIVAERITAELGAGTKAERERAFEVLLEVQALGSAWRESDRSAPQLRDVRAALAKDRGLLVLLPAPEGGHVFAVDRADVTHATLDPGRDLGPAFRELDDALARAASRDPGEGIEARLRAAAQECTRLVLDPVSKRLERWRHVTVVDGDFFHQIPFEYLRDRSGTPLGEAKAVDSWPSVPRGLLLRERAPMESPATRLVLLVAANPAQAAEPPDGKKLEPLPVTAADLAGLTAGLSEPKALRVLDLTPTRLASAPLEGVPLVHIVAHAVYVGEGAVPGVTLVLESEDDGDGLFTRADLAELPLSGLVLLSACGAARGRVPWGNDRAANLGGACLDAGARAVVQSRDPITYREAVEVMGHVTQLLVEEGVGPAEALRRVRAELVGEDRSEVERARLAGYRVLGLGHEPAWR